MRRSNADSMLHAPRAPVKISVAVVCRVSNSRSRTGVIYVLLQPAGEDRLHRLQVTGKKMMGARNQRHMLRLGRLGRYLYKFRLFGKLIVVATQKKLGNAAVGQEGIVIEPRPRRSRPDGQPKRDQRPDVESERARDRGAPGLAFETWEGCIL